MIRYSYIKNRSFQNWALKTSQIDNLISQKLDAIGEYRFSEFAYNSALKLASVLRISAIEDEVEDESYKKEETDVVKFDLPGEIKTYEEPIRSSNPQDETEFLKSMINALSLGGRNIYNSLVHLSSLLKKIRSHSNSYLTARQSLIWMAFEQYYGCEAFDSDEFIQLDFPILFHHLVSGSVDATSVNVMSKAIKKCQDFKAENGTFADRVRSVSLSLGNPDDERYYNFIREMLAKEFQVTNEELAEYMKANPYEIIIYSYDLTDYVGVAIDLRKYIKCYGMQAIKNYVQFKQLDKIGANDLRDFELFKNFHNKYSSLANHDILVNFVNQVQEALNYNYISKLSGDALDSMVDIIQSLSVDEFVVEYKTGRINNTVSLRMFAGKYNINKIGNDPITRYFGNYSPVMSAMFLQVGRAAIEEIAEDRDPEKFFKKYNDLITQGQYLFSLKLLFEYIKKYPRVDSILQFSHRLNKAYEKIGEDIILFSPREIEIFAYTNEDDMYISPKMILKYKAEYGDDYYGNYFGTVSPVNARNARFLLTLPKTDTENFVRSFHNLPEDANLSSLSIFEFLKAAYIYYVHGEKNPDWELVTSAHSNNRNNFIFKDILNKISDNGFFIGELKNYSTNRGMFEKYGILYGSYFNSSTEEKETLDKINKIRSAMAKTVSYRMYPENSAEYQKIFHMIYQNYELRGRDPNLMLGAFEKIINNASEIQIRAKLNLQAIDININPLLVQFFQTSDLSDISPDQYKSFVDGMEGLSTYPDSTNNIKNWMRSCIRIKEICDVYKITKEDDYIAPDASRFRGNNAGYLKYNQWMKEITNLYPKHTEIDLIFDNNIKNLFSKIFIYCMTNDNYKSLSPAEVIDNARALDDNLLSVVVKNFPRFIKNHVTDRIDFQKENILNSSKIIQIFNLSAESMLARFVKRHAKKYGDVNLSQSSYMAAVHDFGNILPTAKGNLHGFDKLFEQYNDNFDDEACRNLRFLGNSWDVVVRTTDKFHITGKVRDLVKTQDINLLVDTLSLQTLRHIIGDTEIAEKTMPFALEFSKHNVINMDEDVSHYDQMRKFEICKRVYERGLKTKLPKYAKFDKSLTTAKGDVIRVRFLPREDPKGMYLGVYSSCCQHPTGFAASCAFDGTVNQNSAFLVCEVNGKFAAQAYVYFARDKSTIVLDSLETIGNELYYSKVNSSAVFELLKEFSKFVGDNINVHIGDSKVSLGTLAEVEAVENPVKEIQGYNTYFSSFTDAGDNEMYTDASKQFVIPKY